MSSNRSISGARQRRAGEQVPPVGPRSNTSINSQQIFAKQQIQASQMQSSQRQQQLQRQPPQNQQPLQRQITKMQQPLQRQQQSQNNNIVQDNLDLDQNIVGKLSIPKAFTLVTLRLGRLEQYIQQMQEEGGVNQYTDTQSENEHIYDSVIKNMTTRLDTLESELTQEIKQINAKTNLTSSDKNVEDLKSIFDKDFKETKDLLMLLMVKYDKFILETNDKISNLNNTLVNYINSNNNITDSIDFENIEIIENNESHLEKKESENNESHLEKKESENIVTVNLKELIENELSNDLSSELPPILEILVPSDSITKNTTLVSSETTTVVPSLSTIEPAILLSSKSSHKANKSNNKPYVSSSI
jgi:hypothetical protein